MTFHLYWWWRCDGRWEYLIGYPIDVAHSSSERDWDALQLFGHRRGRLYRYTYSALRREYHPPTVLVVDRPC